MLSKPPIYPNSLQKSESDSIPDASVQHMYYL